MLRLQAIALVLVAIAVPARCQGLVEDAADNQPIDAAPLYPLEKTNGPWMIKVTTFVGPRGINYANKVAKELRDRQKIDAYVYRFQVQEVEKKYDKEFLDAFEKQYNVRPRVPTYANKPPENWVVLAGNFPSSENNAAIKLRDKIRKLKVQSISEDVFQSTAFQRADKTFRSPFGSACLVPNPLAPKEQKQTIDKQVAKMLIALNDDQPMSIYANPAPFTLMVQQFRGVSGLESKKVDFAKVGSLLPKATEDATILAEHLRKLGIEAYLFHGQAASLVCVGGYSGQQDPRLAADFQKLSQMRMGNLKLEPQLIITPRRPEID